MTIFQHANGVVQKRLIIPSNMGVEGVVEFIVARRIVDSLLYFNMKRRENKYDTSMQKLHS